MYKLFAAAVISAISINAHANSALAVPQNAHVKQGEQVSLNAMFTYSITNNSNSLKNYVGEEKIECDGKRWINPIRFSLPAHGSTSKKDFGSLKLRANARGHFPIHASITIVGNPSVAHKANATLTVN